MYFTVSSFYNSKEAILLHKDQPIGTGIYLTSVDGKLSTLLMAAINIVIIIQKGMAVWPSLCTSQKIHLRWTFLNLLSPIRPQEGRKKTTFQNCKYVSLSQLYNCLFCIANRRMMYFYGRRQRWHVTNPLEGFAMANCHRSIQKSPCQKNEQQNQTPSININMQVTVAITTYHLPS